MWPWKKKISYSMPVMYIKNALALLHKTFCLCWLHFWNPRTRNFQMRVQPVPSGSQTWTRVLFFKLRLLFCVLGRISTPALQESSIRWALCAPLPVLPTVLPCFFGEPHSPEILCFQNIFPFLAITKCFVTNSSPCQENNLLRESWRLLNCRSEYFCTAPHRSVEICVLRALFFVLCKVL